MKKIMSLALVGAFVAGGAFAQTSDSATGTATAVIIAPLSVTNGDNMNFGRIIQPSAAQSVILAPGTTGAGTVTGATAGHMADHAAGTFTIAGEQGKAVEIVIGNATLKNANNDEMALGTYVVNDGSSNVTQSSYTLPAASNAMRVGGTLGVAASQAAGDYTGAYTITVSYK